MDCTFLFVCIVKTSILQLLLELINISANWDSETSHGQGFGSEVR
jgi:hypothetical protein